MQRKDQIKSVLLAIGMGLGFAAILFLGLSK